MDRGHKREPLSATYAGLDDAFASPAGGVLRPLCLCVPGGVPMYVAWHGDERLVKRMPLSGYRHAPGCPHFGRCEPAAPRAAGSATFEQRADLETPDGTLTPARIASPDRAVAAPAAPRLSLLALLHDLWIRAELTKWHPGFAGKRHWGIVRRHLLRAAREIRTPTGALARRIYVPEVFNVERAEAIRERRDVRWKWILREDGAAEPSMVVIGELKTLRPGRPAARAWLKHLPDLPLLLREGELRRIGRRFAAELAMRGEHEALHTVCIATVVLDRTGAATVVELELMVCSPEWIPLAGDDERALVAKLIEERRRFTKHLNLQHSDVVTVGCLHDVAGPVELLIDRSADDAALLRQRQASGPPSWTWRAATEPMPPLPGATSDAAAAAGESTARPLPGRPNRSLHPGWEAAGNGHAPPGKLDR